MSGLQTILSFRYAFCHDLFDDDFSKDTSNDFSKDISNDFSYDNRGKPYHEHV